MVYAGFVPGNRVSKFVEKIGTILILNSPKKNTVLFYAKAVWVGSCAGTSVKWDLNDGQACSRASHCNFV
jgi:hypothetical protein